MAQLTPDSSHAPRGTAGTEDSYVISPMQQGMLFHSLLAPHSEMYVRQVILSLHEGVDAAALRRAWEAAVRRHAILRSGLRWEGLDEPMQEVHAHAPVPFEEADWRGLSGAERDARLESFLQAERQRGFDFSRPPLMRLHLFRFAEEDYRLVWTFHHVLSDASSDVLLLKEVFSRYEASRRGEDAEPASATPFSEHAEWLRRLDADGARAYWRGLLEGFAGPTPLPAASSRAAGESSRPSGEQSVRLPEELTSALKSFAQRHGLTLNTLMQAAWALLLGAYSREREVVFGAARACRRSALGGRGAEEIVGPFVNILPVRVPVSDDAPLAAWLKGLRDQWLAMRDYEHTPLVKIQEWVGLPHGVPLFDSVLTFDRRQMNTLLRALGEGWLRREVRTIQARTNYGLTLAGYGEDSFLLSIRYDTGRFDGATVRRMLGHLREAFEGFLRHEGGRLSDISLLPEAELHQVLYEWNGTRIDYPADACAHALFEAQAARAPEATALVFGDSRVTYGELEARANRLAHRLRRLDVGAETRVGLLLGRSPELVVGVLGVLKAGGAYVALDPAYPKERLSFILRDARAGVLLTQAGLAEGLEGHAEHVIRLDEDWQSIAAESARRPHAEASTRNAAYVIYTSGSTGTPKGVVVEHRSLCNLISWHNRAFAVGPEDRATQLAGLGFDASVWEMWPYLAAGASLYLPDEETRLSPTRLVEWLASEGVTICFLPTPLAEEVLSSEWPRLAALRIMLTGGDRLQRARPAAAPFRLVNNYGPTEATVVTTSCVVADAGADGAAPPIGRPISNAQVYILSRRLRPVPVGAPGELYVGGEVLARGYLSRPGLTAESFIPNPFADAPGARLYRTGDLGRFLPDGAIEFLGRVDHQVKIRGFRIELGEIEATLKQHPAVKQCVAVAREDAPGNRYIAAYVVADEQADADGAALRDFLRRHLPEHAVPAAFVTLDRLPLTANGKIDRERLPAPDESQSRRAAFVAPRSPVEESLAEVWKDVLGVERVGVHDNFFELRGNSLLVVRLISRLRQMFEVDLPLNLLFEAPTVAQLAVRIAEAQLGGVEADADEAARLLEELERLPDEAVRAMLDGDVS
nr:condensation domain-containing protein [uncultured bacterium]